MSVGVAAAGYLAMQWLARAYGTCPTERQSKLPGDDLVARPQTVVTHATTIGSPPSAVWPWLVQMGWHRAGWYTARWVDRLFFPANASSADAIVDDLQGLRVGDFVPDGPPASQCGFTVRELVDAEYLVLHSTSHLPLSWRVRERAQVEWTWAFVLRPVDDHCTRLVFRWRCRAAPWWLVLVSQSLIVPADFWMSRSMLQGLRRRVAGKAAVSP